MIGTIFCYFVQTIAQRYTTASKAALFFCLEPVSAGLIGYFFAGELLSIWQILEPCSSSLVSFLANLASKFALNLSPKRQKASSVSLSFHL
ncbi:EamA family transporter [Campylobacter concisus]